MRRVPGARLLSVCAFALTIYANHARGTEYLVVYGAGSSGLWTTEFTFSNTTETETTVAMSSKEIPICPPLAQCYAFATLPPNGTAVVGHAVDVFGPGIGAAYIFTGNDPIRVSVLARAHAPGVGCASADLPVYKAGDLTAVNPASLVLAAAQRGLSSRSNLLLANVPRFDGTVGDPVEVVIEAFSPDGAPLGQTSATLPYAETLFITDVLGVLGVSEVDGGQLRITKVGGAGVMWAIMPITRSDGSMSVSVGAPSP